MFFLPIYERTNNNKRMDAEMKNVQRIRDLTVDLADAIEQKDSKRINDIIEEQRACLNDIESEYC
jgi:hypothetical protein